MIEDYDWEVPMNDVLEEIYEERRSQVEKWGFQSIPVILGHVKIKRFVFKQLANHFKRVNDRSTTGGRDWASVLLEEVCEAFAEEDVRNVRLELVQSAAVAVSSVEDIDRVDALRV